MTKVDITENTYLLAADGAPEALLRARSTPRLTRVTVKTRAQGRTIALAQLALRASKTVCDSGVRV